MKRFDQLAAPLVAKGFYVFPLGGNSKTPDVKDYAECSTQGQLQIDAWTFCPVTGFPQPFNIGISCAKFKDGEFLVVVDVDDKDDKDGFGSMLELELDGREFPVTYTQTTPTGGKHFVYKTKKRFSNSSCRIADGIDIRGVGGYIAGAGSEIDGKQYSANDKQVAQAPDWLENALPSHTSVSVQRADIEADPGTVLKRSLTYLGSCAVSVAGSGGNDVAYRTAATLKDFGCDEALCLELLLEHWNEKCDPPWEEGELDTIVKNAYSYTRDGIGALAPEAFFEKIESTEDCKEAPEEKGTKSPVATFNEEYALVIEEGGHHILWERNGGISRLPELTFHRLHASKFVTTGDSQGKPEPLTKVWMRSPKRRTLYGYCFRPGLEALPGAYNLFRGFSETALAPDEKPSACSEAALKDFLDHTFENMCMGSETLFDWLIGYFAHIFQRPWEKPQTALVFRGEKGVGKNAIVERIGHLLGVHSLVTASRRYLLGNFNGHLERLLLFTLDEAFWSGDKAAEGVLKDLITGHHHTIERKGQEIYKIENRTRVVIIGNEDWVVPASSDERRFAVFNVGNARKQDSLFFDRMRVGMEQGGYRLLLRYLLDRNISHLNFSDAPKTQGLADQKMSSIGIVHEWWVDSLTEGALLYTNSSQWEERVSTATVTDAIKLYYRNRQAGSRIPTSRVLSDLLVKVCPSIRRGDGVRVTIEGKRVTGFIFPDLETARREWNNYIGHEVGW
jgi:hypothetical protein